MNIIKIFMDFMPFSLVIFIVPPIIYYLLSPKGESKEILTQVEVFLRGNAKAYYPCTVNQGMVQFKIDETEYNEPITCNPRLEYRKNQLYRTYLFAEGIGGTIDVPPLTKDMRDKIIEVLRENRLISEDKDDYTDDELFNIVTFYNFDVAQLTEQPMMKMFNNALNQFAYLGNALIEGIYREKTGGKWGTFVLCIISLGLGFFMAWSLSQKGVI